LIRIGGHLSYGEYDVQTDGRHTEAPPATAVHSGRVIPPPTKPRRASTDEAGRLAGRNRYVRLDEQEAPRRETARQKKERDDDRTAAEKARVENKEVFRP
jgi:hypothetical protein